MAKFNGTVIDFIRKLPAGMDYDIEIYLPSDYNIPFLDTDNHAEFDQRTQNSRIESFETTTTSDGKINVKIYL